MGINFVTGGTGHLGMRLVHWLLERDNTVMLLVRDSSLKKFGGLQGFVRTVKSCGSDYSSEWIEQHIKIVVGDITKPQLGLAQREYQELSRKVTAIYHLAALLDLTAPWQLLQAVNIEGTRNVLDFGLSCVDRAEFRGLYNISTFAVAGTATGTFYESDLDCGQEFNNHYEKSKFEAEKLIAAYREEGLRISIFRPSIIVGDSRTGETRSFETLYKPLHFLSLGLFDQIPARGSTKLNIVPVDNVAEAIHRIVEQNEAMNLTYHIINTQEITCEFFIKVASRFFGFKEPALIPTDQFDHARLKGFRRKLLSPYLPYLNRDGTVWDATNARNALREPSFSWSIINECLLERLFDYCIKVGYIRQTGGDCLSQLNSGIRA